MRPDKPQLFNLWENPDRKTLRWHVQMVNYVAHFDTKELAEKFIETTKRAREQEAKSVVKKSK
jgi:hypothetical protein